MQEMQKSKAITKRDVVIYYAKIYIQRRCINHKGAYAHFSKFYPIFVSTNAERRKNRANYVLQTIKI